MKIERRIVAGIVFIISLVIYLDCISPTVSFWDCGEFIACAYTMGVPHPPGAPLFIALGRVFTLIIPWINVALRMNIISALASAFTVMVLFFIIVRLIREWRGEPRTLEDKIIALAGGGIGALAFAFTDTFWFNAVEAEVYALSILLTALVFWLTLLWMDYYRETWSAGFLLMIAYIFGLGAGVHLLNLLVIPTIFYLIFVTDNSILKRFDLWGWAFLLIFIGFSFYLIIYFRSGLNPVIDENNPENFTNFMKYLNREQYGAESQFLTFLDRKAPFWTYQIKKMYIRYFGWQFIGKGTTYGPDNYIVETLSLNGLYALPFILGIFGLIHHFKRDFHRAFANLIFFIMTGIAIIIYLNQPDPQPRERDYVYVGSFLAFSIWIGIGMSGILEYIFKGFSKMKNGVITAGSSAVSFAAAAILVVFIAVPFNMAYTNYHEHDRSGNYIAWDYSYNILNSCEKDAILFTNGDNDTFPLWYLQEVEGVRKDVRVVNLSLLNTDWYIQQLKKPPMKVPISLRDEKIMGIAPQKWEKTKTIELTIDPRVNHTYMKYPDSVAVPDSLIHLSFQVSPTASFQVSPTEMANYIRVQDYMILNIISANKWKYPIYIAITVADNNKIGLDKYLRLDGMSLKLVTEPDPAIVPEILRRNLMEKSQYRNLNNPSVFYNTGTIGLLQNYRTLFLQLSYKLFQDKNYEEMVEVLDFMEDVMPESIIPVPKPELSIQIGQLYYQAGKSGELRKRLDKAIHHPDVETSQLLQWGKIYWGWLKDKEGAEKALNLALAKDPVNANTYSYLYSLYNESKDYVNAIRILEDWTKLNPNDNNALQRINELRQMLSQDTTD